MNKTRHMTIDTEVASQIGSYSDAVKADPGLEWLFTSGTPGLTDEKNLPTGIEAQSEVAWSNILIVLDRAEMGVQDIVKVTTYLTRQEDMAGYVAVRKKFLGDARPAFMLLVTPALVWPDMLVEIEVIAAKKKQL